MDQTHQNGNGISNGQAASGAARDKLMDGLKTAIGEAETYINDASAQVSDTASEVRSRFEDTLRTAKTDLRKLEDSVIARSHEVAETANVYVSEHPWKSVGLGAAIGVLLGVLISRR
jgi:ElaB/YqjD/DUF883 family membrane-anchored ribosome-binding protein